MNIPHHCHCPIPYSLGNILISVLSPRRAPEAPWRNHRLFRDDIHLLTLDVIKQKPSVLSHWWSQGFYYFPQLLLKPPLNARSFFFSYSTHSGTCCLPVEDAVCLSAGHHLGAVVRIFVLRAYGKEPMVKILLLPKIN